MPEAVRSLGGDDGVEDPADALPMGLLAGELIEAGGRPGDLVVGPMLVAVQVAAVESGNVTESPLEELGPGGGPVEEGENPGGADELQVGLGSR